MPVCEVTPTVGATNRTEWENDATGERFGFTGTVLEATPPYRLVATERYISPEDTDGQSSPETVNELTLTPVADGTLVTYLITYPDETMREAILGTGMVDGMEESFARLERDVLPA